MKLGAIYDLIIKKGLENDPRSRRQIKEELSGRKREYLKLKGSDRRLFDKMSLRHPYSDTRILNGSLDLEVRTAMVGIDIEIPEILLADRLNQAGEAIDLVMAHHPEGLAWAGFYNVMYMQQDILANLGMDKKIAKDLLKERVGEVERKVSAANHFRSVDAARLLGMPFMCAHTPADNHVTNYLQRLADRTKPRRLSNLLDCLKAIPEYSDAVAKKAGPRILLGEARKEAGKIFVDMTGGTEGPKRVFARLSQAGVGTIVCMHLDEEHFAVAKVEHINVIMAGHIASDNLGMNLLLDAVEKKGRIKIVPCSGFVRVARQGRKY